MSSWFYKLRRKRSATSCQATGEFVRKAAASQNHKPPPPPPSPVTPAAVLPPWPCSPNRASYYFPSKDRALLKDNPKLRDTRFPQPGDIVFDFDVVSRRDDRFRGVDEAMHELKLRPIITRPRVAAADSSGTASPTARARRRPRKAVTAETCRRRGSASKQLWLYESVVVVKESAEPEEDFLASMVEMIAANGDVRSPRSLEELLACYLALNDAEHHRAIVAAFRRAWLGCVPPPRERYHLHATR